MPFGADFDAFSMGAVLRHWPGKTVTESDHHLFCLLTMVRHPLHLDAVYAESATRHGRPLVIGSYVMSLLIGLSEADVSGRALACRGFDEVRHTAPVFHGDTLYGESEVLAVEDCAEAADRGAVRIETRGLNQHGQQVMSFRRTLIVPKPQSA
ncbi:MaoC family dehydratase [Streptomyces sp. YC504]|uniref:MaoC family dehydratase n=1 Tax=Streptomyces mesophilus TaxID=1775132 RepID=A0A6G4XG31_9ACTN|nr:MaoC family dehydratase [Streptomyces mesophilus]NGO75787.1 MaoC family dehydratase [Streptomyces mesophilus]